LKARAERCDEKQTSRLVSGSPVYYGWVIVFAGTLGMILSSPGLTYAVAIFTEHFIKDMDLSRSVVSTLYTGGTLVASLLLPLVGSQIDRHGSRTMVGVAGTMLGLACIFMGFVRGPVMLAVGFVTLRLFGQGSMNIVSQNVINQWWVRRRGLVIGISGVLTAMLGTGGVPILLNWMIPRYGWRNTYFYIGFAMLLVLVPLVYFLFRNRPELYNLQPDGARNPQQDKMLFRQIEMEESWSLRESLRTPAFWVISLSTGLSTLLRAAIFFHMVSLFGDNGLSPSVAASVFLPISLVTAIVTLVSGVLVDRIPPRFLLAASLITLSAGLFLATGLTGNETVMIFGVLMGISTGLNQAVTGVVWANYYGRRDLGSIIGVASTITVLGSALGPMPLGIARDLMGSYKPALMVSAVLPLVFAVMSGFIRKPEKTAPVPGDNR